MKHIKKVTEHQTELEFDKVDPELLASRIDDIMSEYLQIEDVPYALEDGLKQIDYDSRKKAAIAIVQMLKADGIIK